MNFECPICLDQIKYATVGSCMHHFCYFCLFKHCKHSDECPMCKTKIHEIKLDRQFDILVNGDTLPTLKFQNEVFLIPILEIKDPGLTIINNKKGPGVVITKIKSSGLFCKYNFHEKDILLFINDVPCNNHVHVMKQIMNLFQSHKTLKIIKL
jgi:hypothetical protein